MAKHSPDQSLADALERIERVESIVQPIGFDAVRIDSTLTDALLHNLLIASEAITRLKDEWPERYAALETAYPDVSRHAFRRFGDVLRHAYGDIDMAIVETSIEVMVKAVKGAIQQELALSRIVLRPDEDC